MPQPPLPQPQPDRTPITLDQYLEYTPEKLELMDGFYDYGYPEDFKGFLPSDTHKHGTTRRR